MNALSPKQRFQADANATAILASIMNNGVMQQAIDVTMLEMHHRINNHEMDLTKAATNCIRMAGAMDFIKILQSLPHKDTPAPNRPDLINLEQRKA